jgi:hypothetical protein
MKLTELREEYRNILEAIEASCDEGGVIDPALMSVLSGIQCDIHDKLGNYAGMIVSLSAQQKILDAEADRLKRQSKSAGEHISFLKDRAKAAMVEAGFEKLDVGVRKLRIQNNSQAALHIEDPAKVPDRFWYQPPKEISNEQLREAIAVGEQIEGVKLERGTHLRVA